MNENNIKKNKSNSLSYQLRTFIFAFKGLIIFFREELKAKIHLAAAILAITLGLLLHISLGEWIAICIAIGLVFTFEIINTAIEKIVDLVSPDHHKLAGDAKDLTAAAVLISSLTALGIGLIIFIPYLLNLL